MFELFVVFWQRNSIFLKLDISGNIGLHRLKISVCLELYQPSQLQRWKRKDTLVMLMWASYGLCLYINLLKGVSCTISFIFLIMTPFDIYVCFFFLKFLPSQFLKVLGCNMDSSDRYAIWLFNMVSPFWWCLSVGSKDLLFVSPGWEMSL